MRSLTPKLLSPPALCLLAVSCVPARVAEAAPPAEPITISVDAAEAPRRLIHTHLSIPAKPGPLTLFYPEWIPGEHAPTGPIVNMTGLKIAAAGKPIPWRRDSLDMYALRCDVPAGATAVEVDFEVVSPRSTEGYSSSASATDQLVDLSWNQLLLYPAGRHTDEQPMIAHLRLPAGWKYGTALPVAAEGKDSIDFKTVSLTTLVDSPVIAGAHFHTVKLASGSEPAQIDMVADSEAALAMRPEEVKAYQALVAEAGALFGARHYRGYHFLLSLSDHLGDFGLEHHESSDNRERERTFLDDGLRKISAGLLPHEYVHSWNGKYRRPEGLATRDYQQPMKGDLLWVYEGLTQYLGVVLTARSGLWSEADFRDQLALTASMMEATRGRAWRPLEDTAVAAQVLYEAPREWNFRRRGVDFYDEGQLVWLEVDTILREKSGGARSIDDFCQRFHGGASTAPLVKPYTFDEVLKTLNEVVAYDWRGFWNTRLTATAPHAPLGGVSASGYTLVYKETPNDFERTIEQAGPWLDFTASLGLALQKDGAVGDVIPASPAATAGIAPGMKLVAVNGRRYSAELVHDALREAKAGAAPIELLVENGDFFKTTRLDYHGGDRYPHLERDPKRPDLLAAILKSKVSR